MKKPPNNARNEAHTDDVCALLRLSPRLMRIAELVPRGARLADVGTDHGYLPVWLLRQGAIERAIASDVNAAPLARARRAAEEYGVAERIDFRLCAGLDAIGSEEVDAVAIAGMGGETIIEILRGAHWDWRGKTLLLQPMTKAELLRPWLIENGFRIEEERLARDKGVIYAVLTVRAGQSAPLTRAEAWCGTSRDALYGDYAAGRVRKLEEAAAGMRQAKTLDSDAIQRLESDAAALRQRIKEWEHANGT